MSGWLAGWFAFGGDGVGIITKKKELNQKKKVYIIITSIIWIILLLYTLV